MGEVQLEKWFSSLRETLENAYQLLLVEYRSRKEPLSKPWIDETLMDWGFVITGQISGYYDNKELTRVMVINS